MPIEVPTKPWYASRTLWLNGLGAVILVLGIIIDNATALAIPPQALAYLGVALAIANGLLRFSTALPIGEEGGTRTVEMPLPKEVG